MGKASVNMDVGADGVAIITLVFPPVNALAIPILRELKQKYDEALSRDDVKAIVVTGANGKFSGGFDINAIAEVQRTRSADSMGRVSIELMANTIEAAKKPSVAAISGLALGGGLELAMSCHARLSTPKAQLGLPELQLGIIPGFGGTQRLPRFVGLAKAIEMMLLSKPIKAEEGKELGLIDEIVSFDDLLSAARKWALDIAAFRRPWVLSLYRTDKLEPLGEALQILKFAREQAKKTAPDLKHPLLCLDAVEEGVLRGGYAGLLKEEQVFLEALYSDTAKALVHIFFAQRATTKVPGVTDLGLKPKQVKKVAVIGGGLMGSGIVTALIMNNIPVLLKEVNEKFLEQGLDRIKSNLRSRVVKGAMTEDRYKKTFSLVKGVLDYEDFSSVDLVIEAVIENIPLKQQIFVDIEKYCSPTCVLATNTSTIDLNLISAKIRSKDRVVGAHFFSPAHVMPLLEIVRTEKTSPQTILDLMDLGKNIKKVPVVVGNCTGFAVNRVFFPYNMAAVMLVDLGVDPYRIDAVIKSFGMPMGPFRLVDLVGFGVGVAVGKQFVDSFPDRVYKSALVPMMLEDGRVGESSRKGFYQYDEKRRPRPTPELREYVEKSRKIANILPGGKPITVTDQDIVEMIFFPIVNEACRVLDERVVIKSSDLDIASVLGMGFPAYRGGIVFWADLIDPKYIATRLKKWSETFGDFFKPSSYLEERAAKGLKLGGEAGSSAPSQSQTKSRL